MAFRINNVVCYFGFEKEDSETYFVVQKFVNILFKTPIERFWSINRLEVSLSNFFCVIQ